jgi:hypothetical protein
MTANVETQIQVDVGGVGVREGIKLRWSQGFGLDKLNVWQECWWQANPKLVNWRPHVGHKTLGEG